MKPKEAIRKAAKSMFFFIHTLLFLSIEIKRTPPNVFSLFTNIQHENRNMFNRMNWSVSNQLAYSQLNRIPN